MKKSPKKFWLLIAISCLLAVGVPAQQHAVNKKNLIYVDQKGVMRFTEGNAEAAFFGVNYTAPFAYSYRTHKRLNFDLEKAIRDDVYHFARLGFNAFRVHVWDTEISDSAGNLLENEHLRLFDYLLAELKKRKIKTIITPIAFWGNGYPDRDENTPGFSRFFGRGKLTTNDTAIKAQENFLRKFFAHVNPYTKTTYENDRDVIAVEINNEPSHSGPKAGVTSYINKLNAALKSTGWSKPVFYNISQGPYYADAVAASTVDGFSFQWYPSGLVANRTLSGTLLPNVDTYKIPFRDTIPAFANKALMVYEFDAADIYASYMYPAMARSFRGAGFQWATQFAYDPMMLADVNTEYQTHYLNLAYTPKKAISMLIAGEAFRDLPRLKSYGAYPQDTAFGPFRVSYRRGLSEMNTAGKFYYSGTTETQPVSSAALVSIAGCGSSPVAAFDGSGAYFLDKLDAHSWRLEVMPDAIPLADPFKRPSLSAPVTGIHWQENKLTIRLTSLGENFSVTGLDEGNNFKAIADKGSILIRPGTYLLVQKGKTFSGDKLRGSVIGLREFVAPASTHDGVLRVAVDPHFEDNIFHADRDRELVSWPSFTRSVSTSYIKNEQEGKEVVRIFANEGTSVEAYGFQHDFSGRQITARNSSVSVRARSATTDTVNIKLIFVDADANAYSATARFGNAFQTLRIDASAFKPDSSLLLPRPYPEFQPLWFRGKSEKPFNIEKMERLQLLIIKSPGSRKAAGIELESIVTSEYLKQQER